MHQQQINTTHIIYQYKRQQQQTNNNENQNHKQSLIYIQEINSQRQQKNSILITKHQNKDTKIIIQFLIEPLQQQTETNKQKMQAASSTSQSQPSYLVISSFTPYQQSKFSNFSLQKLVTKMNSAQDDQFQDCLNELSTLIKQGQGHQFLKYTLSLRKIMNHFTKLSKCLEKQNHDINVEYRMVYCLSIIAELLRENPKFLFPFTRKFLNNLFLIDQQCLKSSAHRKNILAVVGVIYENLTRQMKLVQKYQMLEILKKGVLSLYSVIEQQFALKIFNKSIINLVKKGVIFSNEDFTKYQVLDTVANFISKAQIDMLMHQAKILGILSMKVQVN